jgi:hypothetical protein
MIVEWLEVQSNFNLITGSAAQGKSVVSGVKLKRNDAYKMLADNITKRSKIKWTADQAKNRFSYSNKV